MTQYIQSLQKVDKVVNYEIYAQWAKVTSGYKTKRIK